MRGHTRPLHARVLRGGGRGAAIDRRGARATGARHRAARSAPESEPYAAAEHAAVRELHRLPQSLHEFRDNREKKYADAGADHSYKDSYNGTCVREERYKEHRERRCLSKFGERMGLMCY